MDLSRYPSRRLNVFPRTSGFVTPSGFMDERVTRSGAASKFWRIDCQQYGTLIEAIATCEAAIMKQILAIKSADHPFTAVVYTESAPVQNGPTMQCPDFNHEPDSDECVTVYHVFGLLKLHGSGTSEQALQKQFSEQIDVHASELKRHLDRWTFSAISEECFQKSSETRTAMFRSSC